MEVRGTRAKRQPPPPGHVWAALVDPARPWLHLLDDEVPPVVLSAAEPTIVVWSSLWTRRPQAQVHVDLTADGGETLLRWTLLDVDDDLPPRTGPLCFRLNEIVNRDLRQSFGQ